MGAEISDSYEDGNDLVGRLRPVDGKISSISGTGNDGRDALVSIEQVSGLKKDDSVGNDYEDFDDFEGEEEEEGEGEEKGELEVLEKKVSKEEKEQVGELKEEEEKEEIMEEIGEGEVAEEDKEEKEEIQSDILIGEEEKEEIGEEEFDEVVEEEEDEEEIIIEADEVIMEMIQATKDLESNFDDEEKRNENMKTILECYDQWEVVSKKINEMVEEEKLRNDNSEEIERLEKLRSECLKIEPNQRDFEKTLLSEYSSKKQLHDLDEQIERFEQETLDYLQERVNTLIEKYRDMQNMQTDREKLTEVEQGCNDVHELNDLSDRLPKHFMDRERREEWSERINLIFKNLPKIKNLIQKECEKCQFLLDQAEQFFRTRTARKIEKEGEVEDSNNNDGKILEDSLEKLRGFMIYWDRVLLIVGLFEEDLHDFDVDEDVSFAMKRIRYGAKELFKKYELEMNELRNEEKNMDPHEYHKKMENLKNKIERTKKSVDDCFDGGVEELYEGGDVPEFLRNLNYEDACMTFSQVFEKVNFLE